MKEKIQAILRLMEVMGITIKDLQIYDDSIKNTKKFPLELYYNDATRSFDVDYPKGTYRYPLGVIINNTVYAFIYRIENLGCGETLQHCQDAFERGRNGSLPTQEQLKTLKDHLDEYDKISVFLPNSFYGICDKVRQTVGRSARRERAENCFGARVGQRRYYPRFGSQPRGRTGCAEAA